jgi:hypothetical protein
MTVRPASLSMAGIVGGKRELGPRSQVGWQFGVGARTREARGTFGLRIYSKERREGGRGPGANDGGLGFLGVFFSRDGTGG